MLFINCKIFCTFAASFSYFVMKPLLDVHTHTVASGHAYSSLQEMVRAAADKGLQVLGITEHGPSIQGTCPAIYFKNMYVVPRLMYGVRLLMGCEINILDTQGTLDLEERFLKVLDIGIAGIHEACWKGGTKAENTAGMIAAIRNPYVNVISHPADGTADLDFESIVLAAKEAHTLLEINNHSLSPNRQKPKARENNRELLRLCKRHDVPIILGSDAHISFQIADYDRVLQLVDEEQFPEEMIMNYWPEKFFKYIGKSLTI